MIDGFPKGSVNAVPDLCDKCISIPLGSKINPKIWGFTDSSFKSNGLPISEADLGRQRVTKKQKIGTVYRSHDSQFDGHRPIHARWSIKDH